MAPCRSPVWGLWGRVAGGCATVLWREASMQSYWALAGEGSRNRSWDHPRERNLENGEKDGN